MDVNREVFVCVLGLALAQRELQRHLGKVEYRMRELTRLVGGELKCDIENMVKMYEYYRRMGEGKTAEQMYDELQKRR